VTFFRTTLSIIKKKCGTKSTGKSAFLQYEHP